MILNGISYGNDLNIANVANTSRFVFNPNLHFLSLRVKIGGTNSPLFLRDNK